MRTMFPAAAHVACVLLVPLVLLRADKQACDGTSVSGTSSKTTNCGVGVTEEQAHDNAYFTFPDVPACKPCETEGQVCDQLLTYNYNTMDERCVQFPITGLWVCCITFNSGFTFTNTCECVDP